jgi:predicted  nucleic acid-binding Zn ribbon protein
MKKLLIIVLLTIAFQANATTIITPNDDYITQIVKSSSNKNGLVKKTNGEIVSTTETMTLDIYPCNQTVLVTLNKKTYDLVLYRTDEQGTIHAATLDGKQIVKININANTNEVETKIGDLLFTTYITSAMVEAPAIAVED